MKEYRPSLLQEVFQLLLQLLEYSQRYKGISSAVVFKDSQMNGNALNNKNTVNERRLETRQPNISITFLA